MAAYAPVLCPEQHWVCPSCDFTDVTRIPGYVSHLHPCRGQRLLMVPMVPAGTKAVHVVQEREDYVGKELVQTDASGRVVMAVNTVRDEGMDASVYSPGVVVTRDQIMEARSLWKGAG